MGRRIEGKETWHRLREWDKGQAPSERLSAQILLQEKYESIDPSHPLGGQDGKKDMLCEKDSIKYIAACYFPRGQKEFEEIKKKFIEDCEGIDKNEVNGIVFLTNQELRLGEREDLRNEVPQDKEVEIYHLERITSLLNSSINYGIRLEFLDIDMTKEEQLSFMVAKDQAIHNLTDALKQFTFELRSTKKDSEEIATSVSVSPEYVSYTFNNEKPFHKCSHCGYGYRVVKKGHIAYSASTSRFSSALLTCPKCGNTEEINPFIF